ncbi:MAG: hypothetical protein HYR56_30155 [Acidobacteria bacterium]|nr:hypothetical protein [Acidobacteriota bacterium]MBI3423682.1 hypothetical protein [Acidobacteriota bacterium]
MNLAQWIRQRREQGKKERGTVAVTAILGFTSFILAAGLAIDVSHMYLTGSELQNAADASAVAGASVLNGDESGVTLAVNTALATQNKFEFAKDLATFTRADVTFAKNVGGTYYSEASARSIADQIRFVKVSIPNKSIGVPFAQVALGENTVAISRSSVAGFSSGLQVLCDSIVPLSAVQDDITKAPLDVDSQCPNKWAFTPGCKYVIRRGSNGNNTGWVSPGNYLILALGASRGGNDARAGVAGSAAGCFKAGDCVGTQTGIETGPIKQGLDTRFGNYGSGLTSDIFPPDVNIKESISYQDYLDELDKVQTGGNHTGARWQAPGNGLTGRVGRRVIVIPIINVRQFNNGNDTVCIDHFAAFFLNKSIQGNGDIYAEYITTKVQVSDGYFSGGTDQNNQFSIPVLYK